VVYYIFNEAAGLEKLGKTVDRENLFEGSMLKEASKVVETYIE
jgi:hypothetical protein